MATLQEAISRYYNGMTFFYRLFYSRAGLHYGLWNRHTWTLHQAILNHKKAVLRRLGPVDEHSHVLDAGCGAGWTSVYFTRLTGARVTGITLSGNQVATARHHARTDGVDGRTDFLVRDFCQSGLPNNTFTHAFASESFCHAEHKPAFLEEMFRVLKPGGRLVIADYFLDEPERALNAHQRKQYAIVKRGFVLPNLAYVGDIPDWAEKAGFRLVRTENITRRVMATAYYIQALALLTLPFGYLLRALRLAPPEIVPHLICCLYQPNAFKALGSYRLLTLQKPDAHGATTGARSNRKEQANLP